MKFSIIQFYKKMKRRYQSTYLVKASFSTLKLDIKLHALETTNRLVYPEISVI